MPRISTSSRLAVWPRSPTDFERSPLALTRLTFAALTLANAEIVSVYDLCSPTLTIFIVLVPPDLPIGSPIVSTIDVAALARAPCVEQQLLGRAQRLVAVGALLEHQRCDVAVAAPCARCVATSGVSAKIGQPQLCRDIHSAVEPDSVSDAIALTFR